ncbi:hypothetical protein [Verminephrobacter aporrectodeae]|uniref:hypothetical protein n=1 Tax=Verminephrobacter aporrectodeae TaxID=1110389 RepID=UPI002242CFFD|nr:hypothetical protein [Verminephrobacter aporrectodeae]
MDYSAGFGDTLSFGLTNWTRNQMDINAAVNKCSGYYTAGEWTGIGFEVVLGGAAGWGAAGAKGAGKEFSHWIPRRSLPKRLKNVRSKWLGNYVSPERHFRHDPHRYPSGWDKLGDRFPFWKQQFDRIPHVYKGGAAAPIAGAAAREINDCECPQ